ncbi:ABC transporter ATP-binding protein [Enterococcus italicus]|uniref:ABC transporter ATP-binding protein n=1 Tax=Enterococcus italicus TaxID=246144 RepID=UPI002074391A|nr:ABC transporter ATP-binding protein [Enterococcus italicus]
MKLMWRYTMRYKGFVLMNLICAMGFVLIELGLPTLLAQMIDVGVKNSDVAYVEKMGWYMLLVVFVGILLNIGLGISTARITSNITADIRDDLFAKTQTYSHIEYEQIGMASLITRVTNDAYQIMLFLQNILRMGLVTPLMFGMSLFMVFRTSAYLGMYVLAALPILLIGVIAIAKISDPLSKTQQTNLDKMNSILRENLSGLRVIRAFVKEDFEEKRFATVNDAYATSSKKLFWLMAFAQPGFFFLFNIVMIIIIWTGSIQINQGSLEVGTLIAFIEYIFHALFSFMLFATVFMLYPRAAVSAGRIEEALAIESEIVSPKNGITQTKTAGVLSYQNVTFAYPGQSETPVIRAISFTANPGETVAFIGSTGSGKSTLVQLIPRFFDVSAGFIELDGHDVRAYDLPALRNKIGYVPQKAVLFSGTIAENLRYGKEDATEEEILAALTLAQSMEFVSAFPEGIDTQISEGGSNLSGGQKQRLAIARAIIRHPEVYIFDDSFSALDCQTDAKLRAALYDVTRQATVLIVAQRVGTIRHADKIIVLNEGQVVGTGTHEELLETCPVYYDIASSQLTEEELKK